MFSNFKIISIHLLHPLGGSNLDQSWETFFEVSILWFKICFLGKVFHMLFESIYEYFTIIFFNSFNHFIKKFIKYDC